MFRACVACWLLPCHWATLHRAHTTPSSLHPPFRNSYTLMRPALRLLFSKLNIPSCLNFSSWVRCSSLFNTFICPLLSCTGEVPSTLRCHLTNAEQKGKIISSSAHWRQTFHFFSLIPSFSLISTHQMMYSAQPCLHWSLLLLNDKNYLIKLIIKYFTANL